MHARPEVWALPMCLQGLSNAQTTWRCPLRAATGAPLRVVRTTKSRTNSRTAQGTVHVTVDRGPVIDRGDSARCTILSPKALPLGDLPGWCTTWMLGLRYTSSLAAVGLSLANPFKLEVTPLSYMAGPMWLGNSFCRLAYLVAAVLFSPPCSPLLSASGPLQPPIPSLCREPQKSFLEVSNLNLMTVCV